MVHHHNRLGVLGAGHAPPFETLFSHEGTRQNVCWAPAVVATCSDAFTGGDLRFETETGGPGLLLPHAYNASIVLGAGPCHRGTGTITFAVKQSIGG